MFTCLQFHFYQNILQILAIPLLSMLLFQYFKMLKNLSLLSITFFFIIMFYRDKEKNLSKRTIYKKFEKKS